jgi:transcriptional regulator ATRX
VLNWVNEFKQWLPDLDDFEIYELVSFKQNYERQYQIKTWHNYGGVLIMGYDMFRNLSNPENKRLSKKMRMTFQEALVDPGKYKISGPETKHNICYNLSRPSK